MIPRSNFYSLLIVMSIACISTALFAQSNNSIRVSYEKNGKPVSLPDDFKITFIDGNKKLRAPISHYRMQVPGHFNAETFGMIVRFEGHSIEFQELSKDILDDKQWTFGLSGKPFMQLEMGKSEYKKYLKEHGMSKPPKGLNYYFEYDEGVITVETNIAME